MRCKYIVTFVQQGKILPVRIEGRSQKSRMNEGDSGVYFLITKIDCEPVCYFRNIICSSICIQLKITMHQIQAL